jgi:hypothetical protein
MTSCRELERLPARASQSRRSRARRLEHQDRSQIPGSQRTREISSLRVAPQKRTMASVQSGTTTLQLRMEWADRRRPRSPWVSRSLTPINRSLELNASVAPNSSGQLERSGRCSPGTSRGASPVRTPMQTGGRSGKFPTKNFFVSRSTRGICDSYFKSWYKYPHWTYPVVPWGRVSGRPWGPSQI